MPLLPEEILNKRYRILNPLGSGPYGAVYRAWDLTAASDVAIKEYLDPSVETQKRFRSEARRLSRLNHPQLPATLDHFVLDNSGQYLISQFIDGVDLQSLVDQYGLLPSDLIVHWLQAVCEPLSYLHQQGQLHLDIKPANIRLTANGAVFLVDSGLPGLGVRPHDAGYGSPEQQAQSEVNPASDIYSLGATLYTLLTAEVPPNALSRESGLQNLVPAREVNPDVEPYLSVAATRAMSLRPDTRFKTAADFSAALKRPVGHPQPENEKPRRSDAMYVPPPPPRLPPSRRRRMETRAIWGLGALLILVIIAGVSISVFNLGGAANVTEAEATATLESAVVAALTAVAPTATPTPEPTAPPTPTPEPFITKTGSRMIFIPEGLFLMGNDESENRDEQPSHIVNLGAFYIDETEVSNKDYAQCVADEACRPPVSPNATLHNSYYGDPAFDDFPVIFVNWFDADTYCQWREARLPSEAEWEKAAGYDPVEELRYLYPWGDTFDGTLLNYCDQNCPRDHRDAAVDDGHGDTAPAAGYEQGRSPLNIYNMSGNVMEWVNDWYDSRFYRDSTDTNPLGPLEGQFKVMRGGSWLSPAEETTVTIRDSFDPLVARANLGFRCAMTPQ
ncbi:MAG: bifunctional serine/threonine-protein kinase/formylglycine-generating enzyme family protein [Candidatus Promineifilaceae bacterium]|nr:bifunctional serine/threonine-protein kinase/formylglycine-generating enzyme family protein [Candidatus Promineifilaceae bacterium]